jgi:hypothetical protein
LDHKAKMLSRLMFLLKHMILENQSLHSYKNYWTKLPDSLRVVYMYYMR